MDKNYPYPEKEVKALFRTGFWIMREIACMLSKYFRSPKHYGVNCRVTSSVSTLYTVNDSGHDKEKARKCEELWCVEKLWWGWFVLNINPLIFKQFIPNTPHSVPWYLQAFSYMTVCACLTKWAPTWAHAHARGRNQSLDLSEPDLHEASYHVIKHGWVIQMWPNVTAEICQFVQAESEPLIANFIGRMLPCCAAAMLLLPWT